MRVRIMAADAARCALEAPSSSRSSGSLSSSILYVSLTTSSPFTVVVAEVPIPLKFSEDSFSGRSSSYVGGTGVGVAEDVEVPSVGVGVEDSVGVDDETSFGDFVVVAL